jgi:putative ABC transport system permease protein
MTDAVPTSRLRSPDACRLGLLGMRVRPARSILTALGVAVGIASVVSVLGITASANAAVQERLESLGTNLLSVTPGHTLDGETAPLPSTATSGLRRVRGADAVTGLQELRGGVYRNNHIPTDQGGGLSISAVTPDLISVLRGRVVVGRFLDDALSRQPVVVLGWSAARQLGVDQVTGDQEVWLAGRWFVVVGVAAPFPLEPDLDRTAMIGEALVGTMFHVQRSPTAIFVRTEPHAVPTVAALAARAADPEHPELPSVSRPSDAYTAQQTVATTLNTSLLTLGAVALVVGAVGVLNVMAMAVVERRREIGVRRALGATRAHVAVQFLLESMTLAVAGCTIGVLVGAVVVAVDATANGWPFDVPLSALGLGVAAAAVIGGVGGVYPALRAARLPPADALRTA